MNTLTLLLFAAAASARVIDIKITAPSSFLPVTAITSKTIANHPELLGNNFAPTELKEFCEVDTCNKTPECGMMLYPKKKDDECYTCCYQYDPNPPQSPPQRNGGGDEEEEEDATSVELKN